MRPRLPRHILEVQLAVVVVQLLDVVGQLVVVGAAAAVLALGVVGIGADDGRALGNRLFNARQGFALHQCHVLPRQSVKPDAQVLVQLVGYGVGVARGGGTGTGVEVAVGVDA